MKRHRSGKTRRGTRTLVSLALACTFLALSAPNADAATDVYVLFSGKNKAAKNALAKALPPGISKKFYNVDLLALADYSGKQKAVAKFSKARIVISLDEAPLKALRGTKLSSYLIIVGTVESGVKTDKTTLHVVGTGTDISALGSMVSVTASAASDLRALDSVGIVLVDQSHLELNQVVCLVIDQVLSR